MRRSAVSDTSSSLRGWAVCAAVNLLLGCVGAVPFGLTATFLLVHPLAGLGLMSRDPTDNDGVMPWLIVLTVLLGLFAALWIPANLLVRRTRGAALKHYWLVSTALVLLPTVLYGLAEL
ncbi:hypothetical protein [Streptomyces mangrovisoli]|uniref:Uncharacterized protein n=1 Tax=Streptomyces mangrovisoli TaxID=1428628 RepID=A0A1J4NN13_9ACTN|nr:hypothetical protein [Streptomyces mangrovisoli]OIJ63680.1 hypothetical protein WN71_033240 [Streptomyces mangrovisoli]